MTYSKWLLEHLDYRYVYGPIKTTDKVISSKFLGYSNATGEEWEVITEDGTFSVLIDGVTATAMLMAGPE